jgi:glycerol-3-phosphate acyltransferase PlsY
MYSLTVILILSYLVGAIPGSLWASKGLYGIDIRNYGSGNAGATNAFRVAGWQAGVLATVVDMGKGALSAGVIAQYVRIDPIPEFGLVSAEASTLVGILAGLAAVVGHMFPVWAKFKGGKGVNTAAGVLLALAWLPTVLTMAVFATVMLTSRYVSLGSITAAAAFPTIIAILKYGAGMDLSVSLLVFGVVLALAIIVAHQSNIRRLLAGNENQVSSFKPAKGMRGRGEIEGV